VAPSFDGVPHRPASEEGTMGISPRLLGDGEYVVRSTRTHVKALVWPIMLFILLSGAAFLLVPFVPSDPPLLLWLLAVVLTAAIAYWVVRPAAVWLSATYTLTNRRLITRRGVFTRLGKDIPLYRIHDVSYEHGLVDRVLGCGTLVISAASERGRVVLPDVPAVEELHLAMSELLMGEPGDAHGHEGYYGHDGHDGHPQDGYYGHDDTGYYDSGRYDSGYDDSGQYESGPYGYAPGGRARAERPHQSWLRRRR
jgi:membrane protein YdbS with pleckstrin-like domain